MNAIKRISVLLAFVLIFPLFSVPALAGEGAYLESVVELPGGYSEYTGLVALPDDSLAMAARNEGGTWDLLTWSDLSAAPAVSPLGLAGEYIQAIAAAPDGALAVASYTMPMMKGEDMAQNAMTGEGEAFEQKLEPGEAAEQSAVEGGMVQQQPPEGEAAAVQGESPQTGTKQQGNKVMSFGGDIKVRLTWFAPDLTEETSCDLQGMPMSLTALNGRRVAIPGVGLGIGIGIYDNKGGVVHQIDGNMDIGITSDETALYVISADNKLTSYDMNTWKKLDTVDFSSNNTSKTITISGGTLYAMDNTGLYALADGALEKRMDSVGTYYGDPSNGISGLAVLSDGTVAVLIEEGGGSFGGAGMSFRIGGGNASIFALYRPADPSTLANRKDFTITALRTSATLRKAASDFQRRHPELNVILDTKMAEDDKSPVDDAIRTLNTDLLAGKGGDVLILDDLPLEKYIEKGILADLTDVLKDIEFLPGIRAGSTAADGKLYAMPAQFSFDTLWGNASVIDALSSLDKLAETPLASGQTLLNPRTPEDWLRLFYSASEPSFRDDQGKLSFDNPKFEAFLEVLYQLYIDQGEEPSENAGLTQGGIAQAEMLAMINGATALYPSAVGNLLELNVAYTIAGAKDSGFTTIPSLDGLSLGYSPSLLMGVNARSENSELAQEFVRSLFSSDLQEVEQSFGLPVVAASLDKLVADAVERSTAKNIKMMVAFEGGNPIEMEMPLEETLTALRTLCDELSVPTTADETLLGFIIDETEGFFKGQVSAQAAAQAVQQRAWSYLNE